MQNSKGLHNSDDSNLFSNDEDAGGFSLRNVAVDELGSDLKKSLKMDDNDIKRKHKYYEGEGEEKEDEEDDDGDDDDGDITEDLLAQMGYANERKNVYYDEEEEVLLFQMGYGKSETPKHEPPATPIPPDNLKPAMKGSGKKEGLSDKMQKQVTWAADVYDPIPSASSTNRIERNRSENEERRKNRQKCGGKSARGGGKGGKDKAKDKDKGGKFKDKKQGGGGPKGGKDKDKKQAKMYSSKNKRFETPDED